MSCTIPELLYACRSLVYDIYDYYLWASTLSDSRTKGWLMVDTLLPTFLNISLYLFIVWSGPKLMRNRKPFKLKWLLVPYNFAIAGLNFYITVQLFTAATRLNYSYFCEPCRQVHSPDELQITSAMWWFYFSKFFDFCDTYFFILRKKDRQLTFLHVYHHATMPLLWWIVVKWGPSGSSFFPTMYNSAVHIVMYSYYGLSAIGPQMVKYLWWKRYLTILQLTQFIVGVVLGINSIVTDCNFSLFMQYVFVFYTMSFIVLFGNFYLKAYKEKGKQVFVDTDLLGCGQGIAYNNNEVEKKLK